MCCCRFLLFYLTHRVFNEHERGELTDSSDQFMHRHNLYILNGLIPAISEYLRAEHPEWYRVGAVYLLYAVYMNQPVSVDPVHVRSVAVLGGRIACHCAAGWLAVYNLA